MERPSAGTFGQAAASGGTASPEPQRQPLATVSATAYRVVRLLPLEFTPGQYALAAKAIERTVAEVGDVERMVTRVHRNLGGQEVRDPYGWLITRGLRNSPCPEPACEEGFVWPTGEACRICSERWTDRRGTPLLFRNRAVSIFGGTWDCSTCKNPRRGEALADAVCGDCRTDLDRAVAWLEGDRRAYQDQGDHQQWNAGRAARVRAGITKGSA